MFCFKTKDRGGKSSTLGVYVSSAPCEQHTPESSTDTPRNSLEVHRPCFLPFMQTDFLGCLEHAPHHVEPRRLQNKTETNNPLTQFV